MIQLSACHSARLAVANLLLVSAIALLAACSGMNSGASEDGLLREEAAEMLGDAVSEAGRAWRKHELARKDGSDAAPTEFQKGQLASSMERRVSFEWSGPASDAVRRIAEDIGYSFSVTGNPPAIEPMIQLLLENSRIVHVLEQIGIRTYPVAEVIVDQNARGIEFRFIQSRIGMLTK